MSKFGLTNLLKIFRGALISLIFFVFKVVDYLQKKFAELGSPNKMKVCMGHGAKAWVSDFNHPHYMAGRKAMKTGRMAETDRNVDD